MSSGSLSDHLSKISRAIVQPLQRSFDNSLRIIQANRTTFIGLQLAHHGIIMGSMAVTAAYPVLYHWAMQKVNKDLEVTPGASWVVDLYAPKTGNVAMAAVVTFLVNLTLGAFGSLTLPSMFVPGLGLITQAYRAAVWGMLFSPGFSARSAKTTSSQIGFVHDLPHLLTLILEGQAYVVACLGCCILVKTLLRFFHGLRDCIASRGTRKVSTAAAADGKPESSPRGQSRLLKCWSEYKKALYDAIPLYGPISAVLGVAAIWEAYEVIHLTPLPA